MLVLRELIKMDLNTMLQPNRKMPRNGYSVKINNFIEFHVEDSKMNELLEWCEKNGCPTNKNAKMYIKNLNKNYGSVRLVKTSFKRDKNA